MSLQNEKCLEKDIITLLDQVGEQIEALDAAQARDVIILLDQVGEQTARLKDESAREELESAPRFNVFNYINPDERKLSKILTDLLDPKGTHSQGGLFLKSFLDHFEIATDTQREDLARKANARTEARTTEGRFIDILVDVPDIFYLGIENKPSAEDSDDQCADYLKYLEARDPGGQGHCLVYLSGDGEPPAIHSLCEERREEKERSGHFKIVSYEKLANWLDSCRKRCRVEKLQSFLDDFIAYINRHFMGIIDMIHTNKIADLLIKEKKITSMLEIVRAAPEVRRRLCDQLAFQIQELAKTEKLKVDFKAPLRDGARSEPALLFKLESSHQHSVAFDFATKPWSWMFFGIKHDTHRKPILPEGIYKVLDDEFGKNPQNSKKDFWTWWRYVAKMRGIDISQNWDEGDAVWERMLDGSLAEEIIKVVCRFRDVLKEANLLDALKG